MENKKKELTPEQKAKKSAYMKEYFKRKKEQAGSQPDPIEEAATAPEEEFSPLPFAEEEDGCEDLIYKAMNLYYEELSGAIEEEKTVIEQHKKKLEEMEKDLARLEKYLRIE